MVNAIRHVGIYVRDLDKMITFYQSLFHATEQIRQMEEGICIDHILDNEHTQLDVCKLKFENGVVLELIHFVGRTDRVNDRDKIYKCGKSHVAITVKSVEEIYQKLKQQGCNVLSTPHISKDKKVKLFFAQDIEGNYLELVEEVG